MNRKITFSALCAFLLLLSISVDAQGKRPDSGHGAANRPLTSQHRNRSDSMRQQAEIRRQQAAVRRQAAEARREVAEARKAEAEAKRIAAEEHNRSEQAREDHPPNENASVEAFLAEANAENQNLRDQRPNLRADNRNNHGHDRE